MYTDRSLGLQHRAGRVVHGTASSVMFVAQLTCVLAVKWLSVNILSYCGLVCSAVLYGNNMVRPRWNTTLKFQLYSGKKWPTEKVSQVEKAMYFFWKTDFCQQCEWARKQEADSSPAPPKWNAVLLTSWWDPLWDPEHSNQPSPPDFWLQISQINPHCFQLLIFVVICFSSNRKLMRKRLNTNSPNSTELNYFKMKVMA